LVLPDEIDSLVQSVYEEQVSVPETLAERMNNAMMAAEGGEFAHRMQANQAIIGFPDDASWNDPARFVLYDEDQPGVHRTLMAQTRLGEESVVAIPLWPEDNFLSGTLPEFEIAKQWFRRAVSLSRKGVVQKLQEQGVPEGWKKSPLLRNCFPLELDAQGVWTTDATVCLDNDLGVVFGTKEKK
jgi:CRISPR-associated endonuclease/helicase Cas3